MVVANFANTTRTAWPIRFPEEGTWYTLFNSDSTNYAPDYANAGPNEVNALGNPPQGAVTIGPYSVLILSRTPREPASAGAGTTTPRSTPRQWQRMARSGELIRGRIVLWINLRSRPPT